MSTQITTAFVEQYSNNVTMLSQQMGSLLRNAVDVETIKGKNAFFEQIGEVTVNSYLVLGLEDNTVYTFEVQAVNEDGDASLPASHTF